jgi:copper resistance protein B
VEYDLLLTQRLILQPSFEVLASTKKIEPLEVGSGLSKTELALRLRYEIKREFAPYVGVSWERYFGQTKEMVGERDLINFLVGLKTGSEPSASAHKLAIPMKKAKNQKG